MLKRLVGYRCDGGTRVLLAALVGIFTFAALGGAASAQVPQDWGLGFQPAFSPIKEQIDSLHNLLLVIITLITLFVIGLMIYICYRFREKANPEPSKTTHNTMLEVVWTIVPVLILVVIAVPSFRLIYAQDEIVETEMTVKAIGRQWYWSYEYPDHGDYGFDSFPIADEDIEEGQYRLLEVDNRLVIPAHTPVRILIEAGDVMHSFGVPALGFKRDAIPGRTNETWVEVTEPGVYYGQCYELCGVNHYFMPIVIEALPPEEFEAWIEERTAGLSTDGQTQLAQQSK